MQQELCSFLLVPEQRAERCGQGLSPPMPAQTCCSLPLLCQAAHSPAVPNSSQSSPPLSESPHSCYSSKIHVLSPLPSVHLFAPVLAWLGLTTENGCASQQLPPPHSAHPQGPWALPSFSGHCLSHGWLAGLCHSGVSPWVTPSSAVLPVHKAQMHSSLVFCGTGKVWVPRATD